MRRSTQRHSARERHNYRPRLAAIHCGQERENDLYAAAPPVESLRAVISSATTGASEKVIMVNDVSRAYMYGFCDEETYVERGGEDKALADEHSRTAHALRRECANARPLDLCGPHGSPQGARRSAYFYHNNRDHDDWRGQQAREAGEGATVW